MNDIIEALFNGFAVDGVQIPVVFLRYLGHGEPYVTYMQTDADRSYGGDDDLQGYVTYYDFDVYSKENYSHIIRAIREIMKAAGWMFEPSRCSPDLYENDTGYYHKTLCFACHKQEVE